MAHNISFKIKEHKSIRDEVYVFLKNAILKNNLKSGERLVEKELADQMDISRTPVREAIRQLESEGLVTYVPRKGVIVVGVSVKDALEIYTIRAWLEGLAARLAARNISKKDLYKLEETLSKMSEYIEKKNINRIITLHSNFHDFIAKYSKNTRLYRMIVSLRDYVKKYAKISYSLPGRLQSGWEEHRKIVDAIANGDEDMAEYEAKNHITQAKQAFLRATSSKEGKN